jgi:hypothetical protein
MQIEQKQRNSAGSQRVSDANSSVAIGPTHTMLVVYTRLDEVVANPDSLAEEIVPPISGPEIQTGESIPGSTMQDIRRAP